MENKPEETPIPEIEETEEDKKLSNFDLKTKYKIYLQTHFQGRQYCNKDMGVLISVSSDCGANEVGDGTGLKSPERGKK